MMNVDDLPVLELAAPGPDMAVWWPGVPAADPRYRHAPARARRRRPRCVSVGLRCAGLLAATALLAACSGIVSCKPCGSPVQLAIVGVQPDPARVLRVCVDRYPSCPELRIEPLSDPSKDQGRETHYPCTTSDPYTSCSVWNYTAYLDFHRRGAKEASGWQVEVTATGGQSADEHVTGVFKFHPAKEVCACDFSFAQVQLTPAS
jgi:hypothetical protein